MDQQRLYLVPSDDAKGQVQPYPLSAMPCVVGRAADCGLQLDFDRISRHHARIDEGSDGFILTDLDSTNGSFVNHQRIHEPTPVQSGDIIHFADHGFTLLRRTADDSAAPNIQITAGERATDTVIGFTALPTGFPVQAPEFFELLNDELLTGVREVIQTANGSRYGHALRARSTHPKLAAESGTLFRLASDLGEEARLAQLVREICLKQASTANLQSSLFLEVHPVECEDPEILLDEMLGLASRYRHLALVCELPINALPKFSMLAELQGKLARRDIEICASNLPLDKPDLLAACARHIDYLRCPAAAGDAAIAAAAAALGGRARILADAVNRAELVSGLAAAGASLFQGTAIQPPQAI